MQKGFPRWLVGVFFAVFLALGLGTAADYGPPWDEADEMDILRMNLWEYARVLHWDESAFEARAALDNPLTINPLMPISQSIEQDHGACAFYPMAGVVMDEALSEEVRSTCWHMWCWVVFTLGAWALYGVGRQLGLSRAWALLGPLLLLVSPRFFAQGHVNNKDIALFSLALCVLWQGLRLMRAPTVGTGLLFALFGAMSANTKVAGLALWGLCGLFVLAEQIRQKNMTGRTWAVAGVTLAAFAGLYALLTPALWADAPGFLRYLAQNALAFQRWQNTVLFRGALFDVATQPLPWYYLPYMIVATTPLWVLALIALGAVTALAARRERLPLLLTLCMAFLPLAFAVLTRTHVYNGWRHFYFVYGPMLALAAYGACRLWRRVRARRLWAALLAVCVAVQGVGIVREHPYQYAYYQPFVRVRGANFNELDYWNISVRDALERLAAEVQGEISVSGAELWSENGVRKALAVMPEARRFTLCEDGEGRYVVANVTYAHFVPALTGVRERFALCAYGQPIVRVYERVGEAEP